MHARSVDVKVLPLANSNTRSKHVCVGRAIITYSHARSAGVSFLSSGGAVYCTILYHTRDRHGCAEPVSAEGVNYVLTAVGNDEAVGFTYNTGNRDMRGPR